MGSDNRPSEELTLSPPFIRKLEHYDCLSNSERQLLEGAIVRQRTVGKGENIVQVGDHPTESTVLLTGFAARYNILRNGKRQITALHVPGDFIDLHSFFVKKMDHSVAAVTPCTIGGIPHETLRDISERHPHLARLLGVSLAVDGAIHRHWIVAMGRRSAFEHTAHLLCEIFLRLRTVGLTDVYSFKLPLTQAELADTLGLSAVHVNRVLQDLREKRLITWQGETMVIEDWPYLQKIAEFDPTFLSLQIEPR